MIFVLMTRKYLLSDEWCFLNLVVLKCQDSGVVRELLNLRSIKNAVFLENPLIRDELLLEIYCQLSKI